MLRPRATLVYTGFFYVIETEKLFLQTPWDNRLLPIEFYITKSLTLMRKYVNFSKINQIIVKSQNCVDFFVFILRILCLVKDKL